MFMKFNYKIRARDNLHLLHFKYAIPQFLLLSPLQLNKRILAEVLNSDFTVKSKKSPINVISRGRISAFSFFYYEEVLLVAEVSWILIGWGDQLDSSWLGRSAGFLLVGEVSRILIGWGGQLDSYWLGRSAGFLLVLPGTSTHAKISANLNLM